MTRPEKQDPLAAAAFAVTDLGLYLDTHPGDRRALKAFCEAVENKKKAEKAFLATGRDLTVEDSAEPGSFSWVKGKFPWEV